MTQIQILHNFSIACGQDRYIIRVCADNPFVSGKEIGNLERILLFSYYSKCPDFGFNLIKSHLWPYTSSFIQKFPEILLYFILLIG